jgi:hypothetical protein
MNHSPVVKSRYYKIMKFAVTAEPDVSIYIDGNVRVIGDLGPLIRDFASSGASIGLFKHPRRNDIFEEAEACRSLGKIKTDADLDRLQKQISNYRREGIPKGHGLTENAVIFRRSQNGDLSKAMELWWQQISQFTHRDQISLPYVLWKTGIKSLIWNWSYRDHNTFFSLYPHRQKGKWDNLAVYLQARKSEGLAFRGALHFARAIQKAQLKLAKFHRS